MISLNIYPGLLTRGPHCFPALSSDEWESDYQQMSCDHRGKMTDELLILTLLKGEGMKRKYFRTSGDLHHFIIQPVKV